MLELSSQFAGAASQALPHFEGQGHACPEHFNPADFLADLVSVDNSSEEAESTTRQACPLQVPRASTCVDFMQASASSWWVTSSCS